MMCAYSQRRWVAKMSYVRRVMTVNRENQATFDRF